MKQNGSSLSSHVFFYMWQYLRPCSPQDREGVEGEACIFECRLYPPKTWGFPPPFFWHNHHRTWCFYASSVRGLTLPFFEERDPGSTPTALWKKRGPPMSFLHCDMFTFVFRHSFFICGFWRRRNGMRWNFNFTARGARKVFLRTKEKWSITPFFRTGNFQPKFFGVKRNCRFP